jgi:SAM-dependent methyltransferase
MDELERIRKEYSNREQRLEGSNLYSLFNPAQMFSIHQRQRMVAKCLQRNEFYPLREFRILEVGCGSGGILLEMLGLGALARNLHGVDLIHYRAQAANTIAPCFPLICADGQHLPYPESSFDLVMQFTVLSSILDEGVRSNLAHELLRVTKPSGLVLSYDFWLNPTNKQTSGLNIREIRRLFPGCQFNFHRITLAPPLARRLVPISWNLCHLLESLQVFNTHYLVEIHPNRNF